MESYYYFVRTALSAKPPTTTLQSSGSMAHFYQSRVRFQQQASPQYHDRNILVNFLQSGTSQCLSRRPLSNPHPPYRPTTLFFLHFVKQISLFRPSSSSRREPFPTDYVLYIIERPRMRGPKHSTSSCKAVLLRRNECSLYIRLLQLVALICTPSPASQVPSPEHLFSL